jgi:hypothetical protein
MMGIGKRRGDAESLRRGESIKNILRVPVSPFPCLPNPRSPIPDPRSPIPDPLHMFLSAIVYFEEFPYLLKTRMVGIIL